MILGVAFEVQLLSLDIRFLRVYGLHWLLGPLMNKGGRMSTSPPLPQLLPEVPPTRPGPVTPASSFSSPSPRLSRDILTRISSPGPEDDQIISMPVLQPNDAFGEENSLSLFTEASREIYMDNVIENLVESYRRRESSCSAVENEDSSASLKKSDGSLEAEAEEEEEEEDIDEETSISSSTVTSLNDSKDDSLEDVYVEWPQNRIRKKLTEKEIAQIKDDLKISDATAVRCALSIPEEFVPTPHQEFIKDLDKKKIMDSAAGPSKSPSQNGQGSGKTESVTGGENTIKKQTDMKLRSAFAKYKKWDEAERSKLEKLGENKILVNGSTIIEIDYTNYIKEQDVVLEFDEDWNTCEMPPLPNPTAPNCQAPPCRLGCICNTDRGPVARTHCGKPKCFFECSCQQTVFANGDDGDIRSRLRPRVSLLNWRYLESAEREKDPPVNYRQLERGAAIYPRMRRVPVAPQRFRNEFILSHKFKDNFGRERRTSVPGLKFLRNPQTVKRDNRTNIYRRNFAARSVGRPKESLPAKIKKCKPCTVAIEPVKTAVLKRKLPILNEKKVPVDETLSNVQDYLEVPPLIQVIVEDGQVLLMGIESMCFFAWTLHAKHPKAVIYHVSKNDVMPLPWLYLPVPSFGEAWVFHQVSDSLKTCTFTYIPEINCVIPSKALLMHFNIAQAKKSGVSLKILWIGQDSKKRMGHIYIFPEIPGMIICGPFPKSQIRSKYVQSTGKLQNAMNITDYVDGITKKRYMGDEQSWNSFFSSNSQMALNAVKENMLKPEEPITISDDEDDELIPEETFMRMIPGFIEPPFEQSTTVKEVPPLPLNQNRNPTQKLRVSWTDAARIMSVRHKVL